MGRRLTLTAADGHQLGAYRADPAGTPKGRVVVIQEIFGVNRHIRSVCDRLALAGYVALAPQLFDRIQRDFESGYSEADIAKAREYIPRLDWAKVMLDTQAAVDALKREGPVAILGFCLGGTVSFLGAIRIDGLAAAVCYYGGQIAQHADNRPRCAVQMHFGELDTHIPLSDVEKIRQKRRESEIHVYEGAGHGFHCDERGSYEPSAAAAAWERSLAFLSRAFAVTAKPMEAPSVKPAATPIAKQSGAPAPAPSRAKPKRKAKAKASPKAKAGAKKKAKAVRKSKAKKKVTRKTAKKAAKKKTVKKAAKKGTAKRKSAKKKTRKRR